MRCVPVVALWLTSFLHAATARRTSRGPGGKRDGGSHSAISYVKNGPALTFHYTTDQPAYGNWIGVWKAEDQERDRHSSVAWHFARGIEGEVHVRIAASSAGMAAGKYKAYLLPASQRSKPGRGPLAGPEEFELAAGKDGHNECRVASMPTYCPATNTCIAPYAACDGQCAADKRACHSWCIPSNAVCCAQGEQECFGGCISDADLCHDDAFGICPAAKPSAWEGGVCCNGGSDGTQGGQNCTPQVPPCNPSSGKECFGRCVSKDAMCCGLGQKECFGGCVSDADLCHDDAFGICPAAKPSAWEGGVCCNGGSDGTQGGQNCMPQVPPCNPKTGRRCYGKCISRDGLCQLSHS